MYKYNIEFGDISEIGHGRKAVFCLDCSVDKEELEKLFDHACETTNFNFTEELCGRSKEYTISIDYLRDLKDEKNINLLDIVEKECNYDEYYNEFIVENVESFLRIFLEFTKKYGGKDFTYNISISINDRLSICMGYGLFEW